MRNDLPSMNPGKAMAQASHASNAFIHRSTGKEVDEWRNQTKQGFGTVLVLAASQKQIHKILNQDFLQIEGYISTGIVTDPAYPYFVENTEIASLIDKKWDTLPREYPDDPLKPVLLHRQEITCAYLFGEKDEISHLVQDLKLHP